MYISEHVKVNSSSAEALHISNTNVLSAEKKKQNLTMVIKHLLYIEK